MHMSELAMLLAVANAHYCSMCTCISMASMVVACFCRSALLVTMPYSAQA